ncbi:VOC family protein [Metabacillus halosaccharovorans]|uniref:VOC family protein n=1 Tax=Metabacillus halosaccharovorans TaxID=930124 RepID=UPI001C1FF1F1|nr:VOC family protein [Metabacillus halosaccharovorans]MBU7592962.1 VOC family protein [Metabacillus halosaccharovorans]
MAVNPYLIFDGNTREVVQYYAKVFELEEPQFMTFGSMHSEHLPPGTEDLIMHTYIEITGTKLMFSDNFPGTPYNVGNNITLAYVSGDESAIRDAFEKLKAEGSVQMELQETPWSKCYGSLTDKYQIQWQFSHEA